MISSSFCSQCFTLSSNLSISWKSVSTSLFCKTSSSWFCKAKFGWGNWANFQRAKPPERKKERADNFSNQIENSLHWISKGNEPKKFQFRTIFTNRVKTGNFQREKRPERKKERADNFFKQMKNSLRWISKGNRPKKVLLSTIFTNTVKTGNFESKNRLERQKERAENFFHKTEN